VFALGGLECSGADSLRNASTGDSMARYVVHCVRTLLGGPMTTAQYARFAAVSCLHCPYHREDVIGRLCEHLRTWELTDFVLLGDLFEAAAASVHSDEHAHTLEDEYRSAAGVLDRIRDAAPDECKLHWLHGNHDDNLITRDPRRTDPKTRSLLHWSRSTWADSFSAWTQYPYRKPSIHGHAGMLRLGQVCFIHGYAAGSSSDNNEAQQMRYALGGTPHLLIVRGHTHRPRAVTQCRQASRPLHCWYANAGTLGSLQPHYMRRRDVNEWNAAVIMGRAKTGRVQRMTRPEWDAKTVPIADLCLWSMP